MWVSQQQDISEVAKILYAVLTVNRRRPLRRLALITSRPPRVVIRIKNPCVRRRFIFLGL
jgi:hypothetical protein